MSRRPRKGSPFKPPTAAEQNAILSATDMYRKGPPAPPRSETFPQPCFVMVRNSAEVEGEESPTAVDLPIGSVIKVGDALLSDKNNWCLWFDGLTPDTENRVAVLRAPLPAGKFGEAQVLGCVFARVDVVDTAHQWCSISAGETHFVSGVTGDFAVLNVPTETGKQLCAVLLDRAGSGLGLIGGCLLEEHPGRGEIFDLKLGHWDAGDMKWIYDGETVVAIDWRHGVPYPGIYATGLFIPRPSTTHGTVWECVALDCTELSDCGD